MPQGQSASDRSDIEVVLNKLPEPIDLEFDDETGSLFWTDRGEYPIGNSLNRKTIIGAGTDQEKLLNYEIMATGFSEAIGLKIDKEGQCIYVADLCGHLWKCPLNGRIEKIKIFEAEQSSFTGLTFYKV